MSYINIQQLVKTFKQHEVLHKLNLSIEEGTLTTLLGPSGCGKSTLLRSIAGLHSIDSGEIYINGERVDQKEPKDRNIGMVFQNYALFPNMTVEENVGFGLKNQKIDKSIINTRVSEMLKIVGLEGFEKRFPPQLSGGQQQRVALARALVMNPKVLLLDEPLSALDAQIRKSLRALLKDIQNKLNMTMIFVTHDQEEALAMSDYVYILKDGHIIQEGSPHTIYREPKNEFVSKFIGNYNVITNERWNKISNYNVSHGEYVAIRPETLSFAPHSNSIELEGVITKMSMLGSILRFEMNINGEEIMVDELNRSANYKNIDSKHKVYVDEKDIIVVS